MTRIMFETFNVPVGALVRLRRHRRQAQEDCDPVVKGWFLHEARARDVAELAQGRQLTNHLRLGRRGRARGGGGGAIMHKRTMDKFMALRSWRSRMSIGRRADVGQPVPGSVIRMERGRWHGEPGLYIAGVQIESRCLRSSRTGSSCLTSLRAWPRPSHGQSRRRVFTGRFCSFLQTWHVQVMFCWRRRASRL